MSENDKKGAVSLGDGRYKCPCGYIYDPEKGDPKHNIPAGTKFEDHPDFRFCQRRKMGLVHARRPCASLTTART